VVVLNIPQSKNRFLQLHRIEPRLPNVFVLLWRAKRFKEGHEKVLLIQSEYTTSVRIFENDRRPPRKFYSSEMMWQVSTIIICELLETSYLLSVSEYFVLDLVHAPMFR